MKENFKFKTLLDFEKFITHLIKILPQYIIFTFNPFNRIFYYEYKSNISSNSFIKILKENILLNKIQQGKYYLEDRIYKFELLCHITDIYFQDINEHRQLFFIQILEQTLQPIGENENLANIFNSQSVEMKHMFSIIQRVAITEFPVLVRGESGSGKELVAKAIHNYSQRKNHIFIAINCAALNANLLESELFGHVKGAFTGAIREHKGVFERAAGGTLFLDEIAEIPLELQAKLLRVLETGEFTPLGGEKSIKANVRIISATHRALREEAKLGRFRQDLLYRLRVIPIFIPPLRDRKEDIPALAESILNEHRGVFNTTPILSNDALKVLINYDWPGNVRELRNTLLYALTMAQAKLSIDLTDLPDEICESQPPSQTLPTDIMIDHKKINRANIQRALIENHYDLSLAANALGISRTTLWRYRKKFNL